MTTTPYPYATEAYNRALRQVANQRQWGSARIDSAVFMDTVDAYNGPGRHYHRFHHIERCMQALEPYGNREDYPNLVFALLWHDVIYVPGEPNNEHDSATVAEYYLTVLGLKRLVWMHDVANMIHETQTHTSEYEPEALVCSIDMLELADPDRYWLNADLVRSEFSMYSDEQWRSGRIAFLESVHKPFRHPDFLHLNEPALRNTQEELEQLGRNPLREEFEAFE